MYPQQRPRPRTENHLEYQKILGSGLCRGRVEQSSQPKKWSSLKHTYVFGRHLGLAICGHSLELFLRFAAKFLKCRMSMYWPETKNALTMNGRKKPTHLLRCRCLVEGCAGSPTVAAAVRTNIFLCHELLQSSRDDFAGWWVNIVDSILSAKIFENWKISENI